MTASPQLDVFTPPAEPLAVQPPWRDIDDVHEPLARLGDPDTSHKAARDYSPEAKLQNGRILGCLEGMGEAGGDAYLIADRLNGGDPTKGWNNVIVNRRLAGLRQAGLALRLHATTTGGDTHKASHIHVAAVYRRLLPHTSIMREPARRPRRPARAA